MPREAQIENPQGAFGYVTTASSPPYLHSQTIQRFRNLSTARGIPAGAPVILAFNSTVAAHGTTAAGVSVSGLTTIDEGCFMSTVLANAYILGIAITSCAARTTASTLGVGAPTSEYVDVVRAGPVYANVSTAVAAGDFLVNGVGAATTGTTADLTTAGAFLQPLTTASITSGAVGAIIGVAMSSALTTGSTGYLSTLRRRALVWVDKSMFRSQGANTTA